MIFRKTLLATTMLMVPLAAEAQTANEPVTGVYVGAGGGFNIKVNPNINNITSNIPVPVGLTRPMQTFRLELVQRLRERWATDLVTGCVSSFPGTG
jgi:hypothetical protein